MVSESKARVGGLAEIICAKGEKNRWEEKILFQQCLGGRGDEGYGVAGKATIGEEDTGK